MIRNLSPSASAATSTRMSSRSTNRSLSRRWRTRYKFSGKPSAEVIAARIFGRDAEVLKKIFEKLNFVESFIKLELKKKNNSGALSTAAVTADAKRKRGGLKGYRAGMHPQPVVGFEASTRRAKPLCPRCPAGAYHGWRECPLGGLKPEHAGTAAAYCSLAELSQDEQHALSLCYIFQRAAEEGSAAFAGAAEQ
ncbi:hypothetical protein CYMTET_5950 [Cymbomonas tetramitiformis]|uniref:Uncharacterized protein n=1 Tax=Cymbomonas tetramitiformis TaxID=36881 RepID=A0AAE0LID6_9CHLO|nr:hypothetical protein CYMTET_5950 [Cymbomonas tetramitiformis]